MQGCQRVFYTLWLYLSVLFSQKKGVDHESIGNGVSSNQAQELLNFL